MDMSELPEPWLRGAIAGVNPLVAPVLYTFQQAREDLAKCTDGLSPEQIWATPHGFGSVGFHIRHIACATERLLTYLRNGELTAAQISAMQAEKEPLGIGRDELLGLLDRALADAESAVRSVDPASLAQPRTVGRKRLPTTVIGLLTHIAEHAQRHVGQAISAAKWIRAERSGAAG